MTRQERINALEELLARIRDESIFGDCKALSGDANFYTTHRSGMYRGDKLKLQCREPGANNGGGK